MVPYKNGHKKIMTSNLKSMGVLFLTYYRKTINNGVSVLYINIKKKI